MEYNLKGLCSTIFLKTVFHNILTVKAMQNLTQNMQFVNTLSGTLMKNTYILKSKNKKRA